ncbi:hypothetical protein [Spirosoma endbachense]|uniref:Uncharacterized protein n=1 Tax=Spirosoma endbachense TaxID=2666025 RepID=A0A6P1W6Y2_9BACT|nr:hypothetical protein [Spirosoma endbachense]QHV99797.1 hypothetical protein GJR95_34420 [Spirosoma endbachense]
MIQLESLQLYTSFFPPTRSHQSKTGAKPRNPFDEQPPQQPDWLLIFVSILFLLSLLIVWLVDIPGLIR